MAGIDFDMLLKLRVVVARVGEMDLSRWWNTKGQLGGHGASALRRGLPRTHGFGAARSVFAVAAERCRSLFSPPNTYNLWALPADVEEDFDARWESWLDSAAEWQPFFRNVQQLDSVDLVRALTDLDLIADDDMTALRHLRRTAEDRAVQLPGVYQPSGSVIRLLALAFAKGETGKPCVPYIRARD